MPARSFLMGQAMCIFLEANVRFSDGRRPPQIFQFYTAFGFFLLSSVLPFLCVRFWVQSQDLNKIKNYKRLSSVCLCGFMVAPPFGYYGTSLMFLGVCTIVSLKSSSLLVSSECNLVIQKSVMFSGRNSFCCYFLQDSIATSPLSQTLKSNALLQLASRSFRPRCQYFSKLEDTQWWTKLYDGVISTGQYYIQPLAGLLAA